MCSPTAFGARDRGDFTAFLCSAPAAAADGQAVRPSHIKHAFASNPVFFALDKAGQLWYDILSYSWRCIMPTTKVAVTIDTDLLAQVDHLVAQHVFPNRSK